MILLRSLGCLFIIGSIGFSSLLSAAKPQQLRGGVVQSFPGINVVNGRIQSEPIYGHAEIIGCIESALDASIVWQTLPTDRLLKSTQEDKLDIIYPMGYTAERDSYLQASIWLTKDDDYFIFKATAEPTSMLQQDQLKSKLVGVKRGSPQLNYLQTNGYLHVQQVYDYQQLLPLLKMDRVEMLAVPQPLAEQLQAEMLADPTTAELQLYKYYTRDAGFYLSPAFASKHLDQMNSAVADCRRHTKTATAIK